jgi:DNA-binding HxlR family transcriptional regulator
VSNTASNSRVDPHCAAFQSAIDLLGRPWTALILSVLQAGPLRFSELEQHTHGVGAKTLSARLKDLDTRGVIARSVEPGPPVRVYYELTAKGRAFGQVANAIERWGNALLADEPGTRKKPAPPRKTRLPAR